MCYDVSASHREGIEENHKRLAELKKQYPDTWFNMNEARRLLEENRQHSFHIRNYERMMKMGAKF